MTEQYANQSGAQVSTLASGITSGATTLTVVSASGYPTVPNFRLNVEDELMLVTAVSGTTFTVTRGIEGSTAAAHPAFAAVALVLTAQGLKNLLGNGDLEVSALDLKVGGLTGATAASRYVGATASGAPASGTFAVGDWVVDQAGKRWTCTAAGTPGTWAQEPGTGGGGGGGGVGSGTYASRPAAGTAGSLYLPTDGYAAYEDNGTSWQGFGPLNALTAPPAVSTWTWVNQGGASTDEAHGGIVLLAGTTGNTYHALVRAAPAAPYTVTAQLAPLQAPDSAVAWGLLLYASGTGQSVVFVYVGGAGNGLLAMKLNNGWGWNSTYKQTAWGNLTLGIPPWWRIYDDGTTRHLQHSYDGVYFFDWSTSGRTDFLTPDRVGLVVQDSNGGANLGLRCLSWSGA